ncbi:hypothetical protein HDV00_007420 [Rhizophlyctis rosea]|nr:hypothetical protein HDV00_007420 [Rhizophlyctis rosea]
MATANNNNKQVSRYKVGLSSVLADECKSPFTLSDFEAFVKKEHSDENLEFWHQVLKYRDLALPLFPQTLLNARRITSTSSLRGSTTSLGRATAGGQSLQSPSALTPTSPVEPGSAHSSTSIVGPPEHVDEGSLPRLNDVDAGVLKEKLKNEMERMVALYLTPGGDREVNLPATTRKKIVSEVREKGNYHPDIFATAMEQVGVILIHCYGETSHGEVFAPHIWVGPPFATRTLTSVHSTPQTYQLMKTSSYPQFYKAAAAIAAGRNQPVGEKKASAPAASGAAQ